VLNFECLTTRSALRPAPGCPSARSGCALSRARERLRGPADFAAASGALVRPGRAWPGKPGDTPPPSSSTIRAADPDRVGVGPGLRGLSAMSPRPLQGVSRTMFLPKLRRLLHPGGIADHHARGDGGSPEPRMSAQEPAASRPSGATVRGRPEVTVETLVSPISGSRPTSRLPHSGI